MGKVRARNPAQIEHSRALVKGWVVFTTKKMVKLWVQILGLTAASVFLSFLLSSPLVLLAGYLLSDEALSYQIYQP